MTCIVGFVNKKSKKVYMGADSAGVAGLDVTIRKDLKIFKKGEFLIGCTTSFRMIQIIRFSFNPPPLIKKDVFEYMCTDFIDEIRACFKKGGFLEKDKEAESGGCFLVGYKNRLFKIDSDFQVGESVDGHMAIGCGSSFALGSMYSTEHSYPEYKVLEALRCAAHYSAGVRAPFTILNT